MNSMNLSVERLEDRIAPSGLLGGLLCLSVEVELKLGCGDDCHRHDDCGHKYDDCGHKYEGCRRPC